MTLENVEPMAAGRYSCEVSADAPSFLTYVVSGTMDVVGKKMWKFYYKIIVFYLIL